MPEKTPKENDDFRSPPFMSTSSLSAAFVSRLLNVHDAEFIEFLQSDVAKEALHQTKDAYTLERDRKKHWFIMKLVMGYASVLMLLAVMLVSTWVILHPTDFPSYVVKSALAALFVDVLGILAYTWKIVFGDN